MREFVSDDLAGEVEHLVLVDQVFVLRPGGPHRRAEQLEQRGVAGVAELRHQPAVGSQGILEDEQIEAQVLGPQGLIGVPAFQLLFEQDAPVQPQPLLTALFVFDVDQIDRGVLVGLLGPQGFALERIGAVDPIDKRRFVLKNDGGPVQHGVFLRRHSRP